MTPGHLELVEVYFGLVAGSVEEQKLLEVLERLGWTVLVVHPSIPVMPLTYDD